MRYRRGPAYHGSHGSHRFDTIASLDFVWVVAIVQRTFPESNNQPSLPARLNVNAAAEPAGPPPTIMVSYCQSMTANILHQVTLYDTLVFILFVERCSMCQTGEKDQMEQEDRFHLSSRLTKVVVQSSCLNSYLIQS